MKSSLRPYRLVGKNQEMKDGSKRLGRGLGRNGGVTGSPPPPEKSTRERAEN